MNRRNFFAALLALPVALSKAAKAADEYIAFPPSTMGRRPRPRVSGHYAATLEDMLNHCRCTKNALAVVLTPSLQNTSCADILRRLKDVDGVSEGICDSRYRRNFWVKCRDGRWTMILFIPGSDPNRLAEAMRGMEPSYVMLEGECRRWDIEQIAMQQFGRRAGSETNVCHLY